MVLALDSAINTGNSSSAEVRVSEIPADLAFEIASAPYWQNQQDKTTTSSANRTEKFAAFRREFPGLLKYLKLPKDSVDFIYSQQKEDQGLNEKADQLSKLFYEARESLSFYDRNTLAAVMVTWDEIFRYIVNLEPYYREVAKRVNELRYYPDSKAFDDVEAKFNELADDARALGTWLQQESERLKNDRSRSPDMNFETRLRDFEKEIAQALSATRKLNELPEYPHYQAYDSVGAKLAELAKEIGALASWLKPESEKSIYGKFEWRLSYNTSDDFEFDARLDEFNRKSSAALSAFNSAVGLPGHRYFGLEVHPWGVIDRQFREIFEVPEKFGMDLAWGRGMVYGDFTYRTKGLDGIIPDQRIWFEFNLETEKFVVAGKLLQPKVSLEQRLSEIEISAEKSFELLDLLTKSDLKIEFLAKVESTNELVVVTRDKNPPTIDPPSGINIYFGIDGNLKHCALTWVLFHDTYISIGFSPYAENSLARYELAIPISKTQTMEEMVKGAGLGHWGGRKGPIPIIPLGRD